MQPDDITAPEYCPNDDGNGNKYVSWDEDVSQFARLHHYASHSLLCGEKGQEEAYNEKM